MQPRIYGYSFVRIGLFFCVLLAFSQVYADLRQTLYLQRFTKYWQWNQHLPNQANKDFIDFIDSNTPLAQKLRNKWLFDLAQKKDWQQFIHYYKPSNNLALTCLAELAYYYTHLSRDLVKNTRILWLTGNNQPNSCSPLFNLMLEKSHYNQQLLTQRLILALDKNNIPLSHYILGQFKPAKIKVSHWLTNIVHDPQVIQNLPRGFLYSYLYLYGLKKWLVIDCRQALAQWNSPKTLELLSFAQRQNFIATVTLYKARQSHEDALHWFAKLHPMFYNDALLDWQIRLAIKDRNWLLVQRLINQYQNKKVAGWQYWQARALEHLGQLKKAQTIYQELATYPHYYGFLARLRLRQSLALNFADQSVSLVDISAFKPFTNLVRALYFNHQKSEAAQLLQDFISELSYQEKIALTYWVSKELSWYSQALSLSQKYALRKPLILRFPLAYQGLVNHYTHDYKISLPLVYAIMHQESGFRPEVTSRANAKGLMQLLPSTASLIASLYRVSYKEADLYNPDKNIQLGVIYLNHLAKHYRAQPLLMAAAYNAGPKQASYWLKYHNPQGLDSWIETLPWHETRNYLKNILSSYVIYQYQLRQQPTLSIFSQQFNKLG